MANKLIWIVVSEGDKKALPGINAIIEVLKKNGTTVSKTLWNAEADKAELDTNVKYMIENVQIQDLQYLKEEVMGIHGNMHIQ